MSVKLEKDIGNENLPYTRGQSVPGTKHGALTLSQTKMSNLEIAQILWFCRLSSLPSMSLQNLWCILTCLNDASNSKP